MAITSMKRAIPLREEKERIIEPLFLRGTAIANAFVALAIMVIFMAGIINYQNIQSTDFDEQHCAMNELQKKARPVFWTFYYVYWVSDIYLSLILYSASKSRNLKACQKWLRIQTCTFVVFISLFLLHCLWLCAFNIILIAMFGIFSVYKVYQLFVVAHFIRPCRARVEGVGKYFSRLSDKDIYWFYSGNKYGRARQKRYKPELEICPEELNDPKEWTEIGEGKFGLVYQAMYKKRDSATAQLVAVIMFHCESSVFKALLRELKMREEIGPHPNVVRLIGACTTNIRDRELELIVEYCPFGSLGTFLKARKALFCNQIDAEGNIQDASLYNARRAGYSGAAVMDPYMTFKTLDLVRWSLQIAHGMVFLKEKNVIHGDLSAENILLSGDKVAKINDLGITSQQYYRRNKEDLPWRWIWIAPECLSDPKKLNNFTFDSDMWSYGVTLSEIFSLGEVPHSLVRKPDDSFLKTLQGGRGFTRPIYAPNTMYDIMKDCCKVNPKERISCSEVVQRLSDALQAMQLIAGRQNRGAEHSAAAPNRRSYVTLNIGSPSPSLPVPSRPYITLPPV